VSFAAVVLGLALIDALVLVAVHPQLQKLRDIANDHARAVQLTTGIRARISTARRDLRVAATRGGPPSAAGAPEPLDVAPELARLEARLAALAPLVDAASQRPAVEALRTSLARCSDEARLIEALLARGDGAAARRRLEPFLDRARDAGEAADEIVMFNADQVELLSRSIGSSLRGTVLAATLVTLLGGASALVLLRRALRGLASEEEEAAARATELEAFAGRAAHELRTPLQTMSLALRTLDRGVDQAALDRARRSADRLRDTVDGLLEFARAGASSSAPGTAELDRVVGELREELAPQLASAHVSLDVAVPAGTTVAMAPSHLATVLRNLVGNAVKYASGADGARVTVRGAPVAGAIRVEVGDNGAGIPADVLPRVFEPFVRGTSRGAGYGLGLATVRRLVEAHRGEVRISSAPGTGTTVELVLPAPAGR
jgi:signal transduction histidine kinase